MELGRYRILSQLGQGGMATVYLGEDPLLNRLVAIKVIQAHLSYNSSLIERFTVEAKTIAALRHMNIVEVFDFGVQDNQQFLVMEYIDGQNLQTLLGAMAGRPMESTLVAAIICQAAEGLTSAERHGVVHRDIKPENLLFNSEGVLKIADFGIAHIADEQSRTQTGAVLGSPNFMSPEQIEGVKPSHRTDLFSLGGVFYYALTGKLPFTGPSIPVTMRNICEKPPQSVLELNPEADPFLISLIDALVQKAPENRPEGARWLSNQLRSWLNHKGVVDIVEHSRNFIQSLGLTSNQTISEGTGPQRGSGIRSGTGSEFKLPGRPLTGVAGGMPSGIRTMGAAGGTFAGGPPNQTYQPTTGAMGPSSRSPMVWVGALIAVAVLILAGVIVWTKLGGEASPPVLVKSSPVTKPTPTSVVSPGISAPAAVAAPTNFPNTPVSSQPENKPAVNAAKPIASQNPSSSPASSPGIEPTRVNSHRQNNYPSEFNVDRPNVRVSPKKSDLQRPHPENPGVSTPETTSPPQGVGFLLVKSAPPFAALTINGKPQGETPMNSWLEVPVGKAHIEIVHRLTPPFDTTINVTAGSRQEFKFKLDR